MRYQAFRTGYVGNRRIRPNEIFDSEVDCTPFANPIGAPEQAPVSAVPPDEDQLTECNDGCLCLPPLIDVVDDRSLSAFEELDIFTSQDLRDAILNGRDEELVNDVPYFNARRLSITKERLQIGADQ